MHIQKRSWMTWFFAAMTVLTVLLMLGNTLHRTTRIQLPPPVSGAEQSAQTGSAGSGALTVIAVTPETVQAAIATLDRPSAYQRTVTTELIWSGGSGTTQISTAVRGVWSRADRFLTESRIRHSITNGETTYIWYNGSGPVYETSAASITADNEQMLPTYEDILSLPVEQIAAADYRTISGVNCIYVETKPDGDGCAMRYWVSVDNGLLTAAERLVDGEAIYRMAAPDVDQTVPEAAVFTLPDGRVLIDE